jgi:hypothetical protein
MAKAIKKEDMFIIKEYDTTTCDYFIDVLVIAKQDIDLVALKKAYSLQYEEGGLSFCDWLIKKSVVIEKSLPEIEFVVNFTYHTIRRTK